MGTTVMGSLPKAARHLEADSRTRAATPEYRAWRDMITRCENWRRATYKDYGGRGIHVWAGWRHDYSAFLAAVGRRPSAGHRLERKDNNKGYLPGNVCWASAQEQARNTRRNRFLTAQGQTLRLCEWAERLGVDRMVITDRLRRLGWTVEQAVSTPLHERRAI